MCIKKVQQTRTYKNVNLIAPKIPFPFSDICPSDKAVTKECCCSPGFYKSYSKCVPEAEIPGAIFCGKNGCQAGEHCTTCPEDCGCRSPEICDPFSDRTHPETYCSPKFAFVFISEDMSWWDYLFAYWRMKHVEDYYKTKGYQVRTKHVKDIAEIAEYLANPSTKAMAFIGHAGVPGELEGARIDTIKSAIAAKAKHKWVSEGFSVDNASERGAYRANNLNLEEAYIFACYSSDTTALADYLLMPGGIYWGCQGSLGGTDFLTSYTKPK